MAVLTGAVAAWPAEQAFAELAAAGVDGVEVVLDDPAVATASRVPSIEDVERLVAAHGLQICGLAAPVGLAIGTREVVAALQAADRLGAPWVRVFAPEFVTGRSAARQLADLVRCIEAALAETRAAMLIELSQETLIPSPELARQVLEPFGDRAGVVFDPANMLVEGNLPPEYAISLLGDLLRHVHVKNALLRSAAGSLDPVFVPLARGVLDWPRIVALLDDHSYDGWYSIDRLAGVVTRRRLRRELADLRSVLDPHGTGSAAER